MKNHKIFIVDDEINLTKMLRQSLDDTEKHETRAVNDAQLAMQTIEEYMQ
ncbi:MAG: hypothetical protein HN995_01805 [Candidatus Marinimicrobia bacterium]|jgi:DNA-binding NtrC family response regulator|nr:hypothetical protein [Candidatus Neomarinimicrobiota bacterium]